MSMTDKVKASPEWASEAVVKRLQESTSPGQPSSVQIFLNDDVPASELAAKAKEIIDDTSARLNLSPGAAKIGKFHNLARSFSVTSDEPKLFDAISKRGDVKTILESVQRDILPKPRNVKEVP
jgi:hypothetical protein